MDFIVFWTIFNALTKRLERRYKLITYSLKIKSQLYAYALLFITYCAPALGDTSYTWYVFNIPPFGSESKGGIGYDLVNAYNKAGLENRIIVANPARWAIDMTDPNNETFWTSGSWKLPNTSHRVYSDSIVNTVDYGVAVRPELYKKLSNNGQLRTVSIMDVINSCLLYTLTLPTKA